MSSLVIKKDYMQLANLFSIEQLGYYLDSSLKINQRPVLPEKDQAQLLFILESLAMAVDKNQTTTVKNVPEIEGLSKDSK